MRTFMYAHHIPQDGCETELFDGYRWIPASDSGSDSGPGYSGRLRRGASSSCCSAVPCYHHPERFDAGWFWLSHLCPTSTWHPRADLDTPLSAYRGFLVMRLLPVNRRLGLVRRYFGSCQNVFAFVSSEVVSSQSKTHFWYSFM